MAEGDRAFSYLAFDAGGRKVRGLVPARSDGEAFERLKRDGLAPIRLRPVTDNQPSASRARGLSDRELAGFLSDLATLLRAGADMRASLSVIGARGGAGAVRTLARVLAKEIGGGDALDQAFLRNLGKQHAFVASLVAAGEAAGDLSAGFQRAAEMLESRIKFSDQMVSVLSYPLFVLASTILAFAVILLFVVPSLAPLVEDAGAKPPATLKVMIDVSTFLRGNFLPLGAGLASLIGGLVIAAWLGALTTPVERLMMDGPPRRTASGLAYGAFAIALGNMLAAGAPISDALRLSIRSVRWGLARARLAPVAQAVRQGESLPTALERVAGFPPTIVRLAAVGELSGALGLMLARGGRLEEEAAIRRIEAIGRILGPALIILLGGMIGLLMAGLLSGVSQLGDSSLQ